MKNGEDLAAFKVVRKDFVNSVVVDGLVEPIRFTTLSCPGNVDGIVTYLIDDGTYVKEGDTVCIIEDNNQQTNFDNLSVQLENATAELNKVKADLTMQYALLEAQVSNNQVDTEIARLDSLQLRFATSTQRKIKELELERALIEREKFKKKLKSLDIINQSEIKKMELNIRQLTNRLESAKKILDELVIKASKDGLAIVSNSRMTGEKLKEGDNVWNGMPVVTLPEMDKMKVKMWVSETDFKYIGENDSVEYRFDAMPGNSGYGRVVKKMPVGQPVKRNSKVKYFEVEASIDSVSQLPEPGFTANCRVIGAHVEDTIVVPQIAIYDEDSMKVVFVHKKKKYEMREVATGLVSMKEAIISGGLDSGEVISLTRPLPSAVRGKRLFSDTLQIKE